ncbi:MAG: thioredoxin family protein [Planctomycetaceae bacterium]
MPNSNLLRRSFGQGRIHGTTTALLRMIILGWLGPAALAAAMAGCSDVSAGCIAWRKDYATAYSESAKQEKPILVQITAEWCHHCHRMIDETFCDARIAKQVNSEFIPVVVDADQQAALVEAFQIEAMPTTVIILPDRKIAEKLVGFQTPEELHLKLTEVVAAREVSRLESNQARPTPPAVPTPPAARERATACRHTEPETVLMER